MSEIQPGDVVCLKSGSPYMTVSVINDNKAFCWHVNPNLSFIITGIAIPLVVLRKVTENINFQVSCKEVLNSTALSPRSK